MVIIFIMMMTCIIIIVIMMRTTLIVNKPRNVETLVRDVNSHMRQRQENLLSLLLFYHHHYHHYNYYSFSRQEQERLKTIIARIDSYEPIETKDEELQVQTTKQHPSTLFCRFYLNQIQKSNKTAKALFDPVKLPGLTCDVDVVGLDLPDASLRGQPEETPAHGGRAQGAGSNIKRAASTMIILLPDEGGQRRQVRRALLPLHRHAARVQESQ